jgi:hypothetical protein
MLKKISEDIPSGGDRGFYGHKRLDGKGFV